MSKDISLINLESLIDLSSKLNQSDDHNFILNSALLSLQGKFAIMKGIVWEKTNNHFDIIISKGKIDQPPQISDIISHIGTNFNSGVFEYSSEQIAYLIPISYKNELLAIVGLGVKITQKPLSDDEKRYADMVVNITANALTNADNYKSLQLEKAKAERKSIMLNTLFEMSIDFSTLLTKDTIIQTLSYHLMGQLMINKFAVIVCTKNGKFDIEADKFNLTPKQSVFKEFCNLSQPIAVSKETVSQPALVYCEYYGIALISPMMTGAVNRGLLFVGRRLNGEFIEDNFSFLKALANTSIAALENARLFEEELEKQKIESELEVALEIQQNLLPQEIPTIYGFDIWGESTPSQHVGGDYFDILEISGNRHLIVIADVSGKGVPAALIMANLQAALIALSETAADIPELFNKLNKLIYRNTSADKFVTLFAAIIDPAKRTFTYSNAGHNHPLFINNKGEVKELTEGGIILGVLPDEFPYQVGQIELTAGSVLLLYTDGANEAENLKKEQYGEERIIELSKKAVTLNWTAKQLVEKLHNDILYFAKDAPQKDDLTFVAIKAN